MASSMSSSGVVTLRGERTVLAPGAAAHVPELRRILATPEVRLRWRVEDASPGWPFDDPSATRYAVLVEGAVRGMVQYGEEDERDYRHASSTSSWTLRCTGVASAATPWRPWPGTWCATGATIAW